ncbi:hypothetical protein UlMin_003745 [Ulmus minor]
MSSSDDEGDALPHSVVEYYFEDKNNEPVSFSVLPIQWSEGEGLEGEKEQVFLRGTGDDGLKIYKQAIAWKFDLSNVNPEISVLSKDKSWIKLQKPRKIFEKIIKSILVTVHCLHYLQKNPETSEKSLWDRLSKVFRSFEDRPNENDLVDNFSLINEAVKRDDTLAKSKFLSSILEEKPRRRELPDKDIQAKAMSRFIVDDTDDMIDDEDEDEDEFDDDDDDDELFDSVCAFCDNGGELVCCDGRCMRSFHATEEDGEESHCDSLGLTKEEVEAKKFYCQNCEYRQHQCFACGKLGSSDKSSGAAEVFQCVNATCGLFYHPSCVAKILHRDNQVSAELLKKKIAQGESFTCPIHKCCVCKQGENKKESEFQFAVCRRCPTSYHRKCLPRDISFEGMEVDGLETRAWESLLPNRILIYCLKHEIDQEIGTPIRDHLKFPDVGEKKSTFRKNVAIEEKKRKLTSESLGGGKKSEPKTRYLFSEEPRTSSEKSKLTKKSSSFGKIGGKTGSGNLSIRRKVKVNDASKKEFKSPLTGKKKSSLGDELYDHVLRSEKRKVGKYATPDHENKTTTIKPAAKNLSSELPPLDPDSERRILNLIKEAESSINIEDIREKQQCASTDSHSLKNTVENIHLGKVEGAIEAVRTALQKLDEGCSIEDATAVCEPAIISQIFKWKNKFKIYLAPFLHGMRYTSFGRHFTKPEKLKEIVDKLHWYVQAGDMIVDFCCGSNDFSIFMKKKLEETGKKCLYKNYDRIQTKNDFNFEMRDWMSVKPDELPTGSKLIMGLNPPFGIKASLANIFIDKALEFRPKLLILIVPQETRRLDEKKTPYALVWEDGRMLSGKSFYLPGSIDAKDKQLEDWNMRPPPLYLWSRPDWFAEHKAIAEKRGHLNSQQQEPTEETHSGPSISDHLTGHNQYGDDKSTPIDGVEQTNNSGLADGGVKTEGYKEISPLVNEVVGTKRQKNSSPITGGRGNPSTRNPRNESRNARRKRRREGRRNKWDDRSPVRDRHENRYRRSDSGTPSSRMQYRSPPYSGNRAGNSDDRSRMYMGNAVAPGLSFRNLGHENHRAEPSLVPHSYGQPDLQIPVYDPAQSLPQFQAPYWPADSAVDPYMINTAPMHLPQLTGNLAIDPRAAGHHGYQGSLMNFAPGPHHAYPYNSPGWLDD